MVDLGLEQAALLVAKSPLVSDLAHCALDDFTGRTTLWLCQR